MNELIQQLTTYLRGMWQRRWIGLAAAWIAAIVGVAIAMRIPDRYEATARVYVDTQSLLRPLMAGLSIQPNIEQQVGLLSRTLISRPNVEKLIRMTDLDLGITSASEREQLIESLTRGLACSPMSSPLLSRAMTVAVPASTSPITMEATPSSAGCCSVSVA